MFATSKVSNKQIFGWTISKTYVDNRKEKIKILDDLGKTFDLFKKNLVVFKSKWLFLKN